MIFDKEYKKKCGCTTIFEDELQGRKKVNIVSDDYEVTHKDCGGKCVVEEHEDGPYSIVHQIHCLKCDSFKCLYGRDG